MGGKRRVGVGRQGGGGGGGGGVCGRELGETIVESGAED